MNNDIVIKQGDILSKVQRSSELSNNSSDNQSIQRQNVAYSESNTQSLVNENISAQQLIDRETQKKESEDAAKAIQSLLENNQNLFSVQNRHLNFDIVDDSGDVVVKVVDKDTDEVIRQIPSEEFLQVANKINDLLDELSSTKGILFDSKV
ncbi:flagellar protein FlaG [Thalassotalea sp. SU-HH00458]|uniref:flagellar protein FlaG n=1 Tax=Thalassotalea sp. SU-HH00458 TaxID=3127657 RepID=UPI003103CAD7